MTFFPLNSNWIEKSFILALHFLLECAVCGGPPPLTLSTFIVNAALVAELWQHCALSFSMYLSIKTEHEVGQASSSVFQVFHVTWRGIWTQLELRMFYHTRQLKPI